MQQVGRLSYQDVSGLLESSALNVRADKDCVLAAVTKWGFALEYAADSLKTDKEIVLAAVNDSGWALKHTADALKADKEIVIAAVSNDGAALRHAADSLKADKEVALAAVRHRGYSLEYLKKDAPMWKEKAFVSSIVQLNGNALQYASNQLKEDREIVRAAVMQTGVSLKYAKGGLNQDAEMLKASGLWEGQTPSAHASALPLVLRIRTANKHPSCEGFYDLIENFLPHGYPLWRKRGGNRWVYRGSDARWYIGGTACERKQFRCASGYIYNDVPDCTRPDLLTGPWRWGDTEAWHADCAIEVRPCTQVELLDAYDKGTVWV